MQCIQLQRHGGEALGLFYGKRTELNLMERSTGQPSIQQMLFGAKSSSVKYNPRYCTGGDQHVLQDVWLHQKYNMEDIPI